MLFVFIVGLFKLYNMCLDTKFSDYIHIIDISITYLEWPLKIE